MLTIPSLASSPTTLSLPPSVLGVTASDVVSTRITPVALPAPLTNQPVADNAQSNTTIPAAPVAENTVTATVSTGTPSGALANNLSASGPSASFLAQLFGQSGEENSAVSLAATYARFAPAPEYNTFVGYSFIKYKPSDAGLPPQRSPLPSPVTAYTTPAELPVEPPPPAAATAAPPVQNIPAQNNAPVVSTNDFQAYSQTQSRNQSNLSSAQPQFIVAG